MRNIKTQSIFIKTSQLFAILIFGVIFSAGCSEQTSNTSKNVVPLGDRPSLEKLATAYQNFTDKLPSSPNGLTFAGKYKFIERVFADADFNYSATLLKIAGDDFDPKVQLHRDLAELVLFPQLVGVADKDLKSMYSVSEIKAVKVLRCRLK